MLRDILRKLKSYIKGMLWHFQTRNMSPEKGQRWYGIGRTYWVARAHYAVNELDIYDMRCALHTMTYEDWKSKIRKERLYYLVPTRKKFDPETV